MPPFGRSTSELKRRAGARTIAGLPGAAAAPPQAHRSRPTSAAAPASHYTPGAPMTLCYEYIAEPRAGGARRQAAHRRTGLHQGGRAGRRLRAHRRCTRSRARVFDLLEIPVWGREEHAADRVAGFLMFQFGEKVAYRTLVGTSWFLAQSSTAANRAAVGRFLLYPRADAETLQRFYNTLCIALGGDPVNVLLRQEIASRRTAPTIAGGNICSCKRSFNDTLHAVHRSRADAKGAGLSTGSATEAKQPGSEFARQSLTSCGLHSMNRIICIAVAGAGRLLSVAPARARRNARAQPECCRRLYRAATTDRSAACRPCQADGQIPDHNTIYERLKQRQVLEQLSAFLLPLTLAANAAPAHQALQRDQCFLRSRTNGRSPSATNGSKPWSAGTDRHLARRFHPPGSARRRLRRRDAA